MVQSPTRAAGRHGLPPCRPMRTGLAGVTGSVTATEHGTDLVASCQPIHHPLLRRPRRDLDLEDAASARTRSRSSPRRSIAHEAAARRASIAPRSWTGIRRSRFGSNQADLIRFAGGRYPVTIAEAWASSPTHGRALDLGVGSHCHRHGADHPASVAEGVDRAEDLDLILFLDARMRTAPACLRHEGMDFYPASSSIGRCACL